MSTPEVDAGLGSGLADLLGGEMRRSIVDIRTSHENKYVKLVMGELLRAIGDGDLSRKDYFSLTRFMFLKPDDLMAIEKDDDPSFSISTYREYATQVIDPILQKLVQRNQNLLEVNKINSRNGRWLDESGLDSMTGQNLSSGQILDFFTKVSTGLQKVGGLLGFSQLPASHTGESYRVHYGLNAAAIVAKVIRLKKDDGSGYVVDNKLSKKGIELFKNDIERLYDLGFTEPITSVHDVEGIASSLSRMFTYVLGEIKGIDVNYLKGQLHLDEIDEDFFHQLQKTLEDFKNDIVPFIENKYEYVKMQAIMAKVLYAQDVSELSSIYEQAGVNSPRIASIMSENGDPLNTTAARIVREYLKAKFSEFGRLPRRAFGFKYEPSKSTYLYTGVDEESMMLARRIQRVFKEVHGREINIKQAIVYVSNGLGINMFTILEEWKDISKWSLQFPFKPNLLGGIAKLGGMALSEVAGVAPTGGTASDATKPANHLIPAYVKEMQPGARRQTLGNREWVARLRVQDELLRKGKDGMRVCAFYLHDPTTNGLMQNSSPSKVLAMPWRFEVASILRNIATGTSRTIRSRGGGSEIQIYPLRAMLQELAVERGWNVDITDNSELIIREPVHKLLDLASYHMGIAWTNILAGDFAQYFAREHGKKSVKDYIENCTQTILAKGMYQELNSNPMDFLDNVRQDLFMFLNMGFIETAQGLVPVADFFLSDKAFVEWNIKENRAINTLSGSERKAREEALQNLKIMYQTGLGQIKDIGYDIAPEPLRKMMEFFSDTYKFLDPELTDLKETRKKGMSMLTEILGLAQERVIHRNTTQDINSQLTPDDIYNLNGQSAEVVIQQKLDEMHEIGTPRNDDEKDTMQDLQRDILAIRLREQSLFGSDGMLTYFRKLTDDGKAFGQTMNEDWDDSNLAVRLFKRAAKIIELKTGKYPSHSHVVREFPWGKLLHATEGKSGVPKFGQEHEKAKEFIDTIVKRDDIFKEISALNDDGTPRRVAEIILDKYLKPLSDRLNKQLYGKDVARDLMAADVASFLKTILVEGRGEKVVFRNFRNLFHNTRSEKQYVYVGDLGAFAQDKGFYLTARDVIQVLRLLVKGWGTAYSGGLFKESQAQIVLKMLGINENDVILQQILPGMVAGIFGTTVYSYGEALVDALKN